MIDILKELNLENISPKEKEIFLSNVAESLSKRVLTYAYENLDEANLTEFEKLSDEGDELKIGEFLKAKLPDLNQIASVEILKIIEEIRGKN